MIAVLYAYAAGALAFLAVGVPPLIGDPDWRRHPRMMRITTVLLVLSAISWPVSIPVLVTISWWLRRPRP